MNRQGPATVLAILVPTSALVGVANGWLSWLGGLNAANSVQEGASVFGAALVIMMMVVQFLQDRESEEPCSGTPRSITTAPPQGR